MGHHATLANLRYFFAKHNVLHTNTQVGAINHQDFNQDFAFKRFFCFAADIGEIVDARAYVAATQLSQKTRLVHCLQHNRAEGMRDSSTEE
jgi:hypothetical protein